MVSQFALSSLYSFFKNGVFAARSCSNAKNTKSDIPRDTPAETPAESPADALVDNPPAKDCELPVVDGIGASVDDVDEDKTRVVVGVVVVAIYGVLEFEGEIVGVVVGEFVCVKDAAIQDW